MEIRLNISTLADIYEATKKRDEAIKAIENNHYHQSINRIAYTKDRIKLARLNISWIKAVKNTKLSDQLVNFLISVDAQEWRNQLKLISDKYTKLKQDLEETKNNVRRFGVKNLDHIYAEKQIQRIQELISAGDSLAPFLTLNKQIEELIDIGLGDFLDKSQSSDIEPKRLPDLFNSIITTARAKYFRKSLEPLSNNNGSTLDALRKTFSERDKLKIKYDRQRIREKLLKQSPPMGIKYGPVKNWTETHLLKHEFDKQRAYVPVRRLLQRAGSSIIALKPCFMMSPMSASKFLSNKQNQFDLLVIDEASQMRPEDALGAMLRSKQIIVVGDPKQLPPTNFFDRSDDQNTTDDESENIDDESILERCQKVFNNVRRLKWHYRSKCESLIRFSNVEFYENSLITFPAATPNSFSIDLIKVNGEYKAKVNVDEAERVSEEAIAFMHHHAESEISQMPTIGIVTTNINQKDLISDIFRRMSSGDELVLTYMEKAEERGEPFFIKNLENVQGDERDFIFISLNYGFEKGAKVLTQRFGPINTKQGHRRLNVLFSRARTRIALFTSFGSEDVTPSDTSRQGVHTLKRYLQYAETQGLAGLEDLGGTADSEFELEVARRLIGAGFQIQLQVGVSGYKIDIGVKHPKFPEKFLAGVECDGASYHSSKSARDRDRIREEVLNQLGWDLVRIWSTDWFDNPDTQTTKLVSRLNELASRPIKSNNIYNLSTRHYIKKQPSQNKPEVKEIISASPTKSEPRQKSLLDLFTRTKG
jgi:very-short-patch-repair endonuclease